MSASQSMDAHSKDNNDPEQEERPTTPTQQERPTTPTQQERPISPSVEVVPAANSEDVNVDDGDKEEAPPQVSTQGTGKVTKGGSNLTADDLKIIQDPEKFREFCLTSQRAMLAEMSAVRSEQKAQKNREGQMATHVALLALDNAKLHDQFKQKSISRGVAAKLNELALEAGVTPIDAEAFAIDTYGPEGAITAAPEVVPKQVAASSSSSRKRAQNDPASTKAKKGKLDEPKTNPKDTAENPNVLDEGGIELPGGFFSRENEVIINKWGFLGTGVKGNVGCIIRIPTELALTAAMKKTAKAAAADVGSKSDRLQLPKVFGGTIAKYVETVLDNLVSTKKERGPFMFEPMVEIPDLNLPPNSKATAKDLNDAQPVIWRDLLRNAFGNMGLKEAESSIKFQGLDAAIKMLKKKVDTLGRVKKSKGQVSPRQQEEEEECDDYDDF